MATPTVHLDQQFLAELFKEVGADDAPAVPEPDIGSLRNAALRRLLRREAQPTGRLRRVADRFYAMAQGDQLATLHALDVFTFRPEAPRPLAEEDAAAPPAPGTPPAAPYHPAPAPPAADPAARGPGAASQADDIAEHDPDARHDPETDGYGQQYYPDIEGDPEDAAGHGQDSDDEYDPVTADGYASATSSGLAQEAEQLHEVAGEGQQLVNEYIMQLDDAIRRYYREQGEAAAEDDWDTKALEDLFPAAGDSADEDAGEEPPENEEARPGPKMDGALEPARKRRRLVGKQVPLAAAYQWLPEGEDVVILKVARPSRLSRELGCAIFTANFAYRHAKPLTLWRWRREPGDDRPHTLHLLAGRETGVTYYAEKGLEESQSAKAMLAACAGMEAFYARLPLLLTPSRFAPLAASVEEEADNMTPANVAEADGQAEIGIDLARNLDIMPPEGRLYAAWQFRGMLRVADSKEVCLCKGMLAVNPQLSGLRLRTSCVKVRMPADTPVALGLDLTKSTAEPAAPPKLNVQLGAVLKLRTLLLEDAAAGAAAEAAWQRLLESAGKATAEAVPRLAWDLPDRTPHREGLTALVRREGGKIDEWLDRRVPQHTVSVKLRRTAFDVAEVNASLAALTEEKEEEKPWRLSRGTRECVFRGGSRARLLRSGLEARGQLHLSGFGACLTAISDVTGNLPDRHCIAVVDGSYYEGKVAVWRSPCMLPGDVEVWTCVRPPTNATPLPNNSVMCSRARFGVATLSGGDYDGDQLALSADPELVGLVETTEAGLTSTDIAAAANYAVENLPARDVTALRGCAQPPAQRYRAYVQGLATPPVKGLACAMAERAQEAALAAPADVRAAAAQVALRAASVAHAAYDCPKKHSTKEVLRLGESLLQAAGIDAGARRSTATLAAEFAARLPDVRPSQPWTDFRLPVDTMTLGQVWLNRPNLYLSAEAGRLVRGAIVRAIWPGRGGVRVFERTTTRSPTTEVAHLLLHRMARGATPFVLCDHGEGAASSSGDGGDGSRGGREEVLRKGDPTLTFDQKVDISVALSNCYVYVGL